MPADVNCQVCFYYKITRADFLFDGDKHRRIVSSWICRYRSRFSSQVKRFVVNLRLEILKERHIFMETRNIKVGGGGIASRLLDTVSQARRGKQRRERVRERKQQGGWQRCRAHGCIGVNLCLQEFT